MKIVNTDGENFPVFFSNLRNFNEIFRKDMTYNSIKSHNKPRFHPLSRKYSSGRI